MSPFSPAPRTARAIDLATGERASGPLFPAADGRGWTGTAPPASSAGPPATRGSPSRSVRTRCGTRSSPPPSTPGSRSANPAWPPTAARPGAGLISQYGYLKCSEATIWNRRSARLAALGSTGAGCARKIVMGKAEMQPPATLPVESVVPWRAVLTAMQGFGGLS